MDERSDEQTAGQMAGQTDRRPGIPRVLCCWDRTLGEGMLGRLKDVAEVQWAPPDREFLEANLAQFDAYLATLHVRLDARTIQRASAGRLRVVGTPSTGHDHLDVAALEACGVSLLSLRTQAQLLDRVTSTAELAWGLLLSAVRRIPAASAVAREGTWARDRFRGTQISGQTLGVVGVGRLGRMVAGYGVAFGMNVLGCDVKPVSVPGVEQVELEELLRRSDVVSIHVHLSQETQGLIGAQAFSRMKPGAVLINTSRGAVIDESAFLEALESGRLGAAGIDVIDGEWRSDLRDHPLIRYARTHDNLIITPHIGGVTKEAQLLTAACIAGKVAEKLELLRSRPGSGT